MLAHLSISNYALIGKLDISINDGLTIITGETGAGKSILLGALSLVLGQRADANMLSDKTKKCVVEASFNIESYELENFFRDNNLDYDEFTVMRREISPGGKSRAFINDTPVTLDLMKEMGSELVDIHSQNNILTLHESRFQLEFIDSFAQIESLLIEYRNRFKMHQKLRKELLSLEEVEKKSMADRDYFQFQWDELEQAKLGSDDQKALEDEQEMLTHAEEIKISLSNISAGLINGESNICSGLSEIQIQLNKTALIFPHISKIAERVSSCKIELKDIADELELLSEKINHNPERATIISDRLDLIYHLQQKHRVGSIEELIDIKKTFSEKLNTISSLNSQISKLKEELEKSDKNLVDLAEKISLLRRKAIPKIERGITNVIHKLAMPAAEFSIMHSFLEEYSLSGKDRVTFMFNANLGGEKKELSKAASGGELSRFMLAVKSLISEKKLLPTIIFDEIDQGVSGEIADKVGAILKNMSGTMQVLAITHLPQIASKGNSHFLVYKESDKHSTNTRIRALDQNERIGEIARMLSGDKVTEAAVQNAKVLLESQNKN